MTLFLFLLMTADPMDRFTLTNPQSNDTAWQVSEDPEREIYDAVVLQDLYYILPKKTKRYRKMRILSENGKSVADFVDNSGGVDQLTGRVIQRDGTVIPFNTEADFVEVLAFKHRRDTQKARVLVPPGLTDDCIVEMSWDVPYANGVNKGSVHKRYYVQEDYYVQEVAFYIQKADDYIYVAAPFKSMQQGDIPGKKNSHQVIYKDVPPARNDPFALPSSEAGAAHLLVQEKADGYNTHIYSVYGGYYLTQMFNNKIRKHGPYKKWIKQLKQNMRTKEDGSTASDPEAVAYLLRQFHQRISSTSLLGPEKKAQITRELKKDKLKSRIKEVFRLGYGEPFDLGHLFANVVRDCGIRADLLLPQSNQSPKFNPSLRNFYDVQTSLPLIGVRTNTGYAVFMPEYPEYAPGYFPAWMEGQYAVAMNVLEEQIHAKNRTFSNIHFSSAIETTRLPALGPNSHKKIRIWKTEINNDGSLAMTIKEQGVGSYNAMAKRSFFVLPQAERDSLLQNYWDARLSEWDIEHAEVKNADKLPGLVSEHVRAVSKQTEPSDEIWLNPFPGTRMPISSPKYWPANRTDDIFLGTARAIIDQAEITMPEGMAIKGQPSFSQKNKVGEVKYSVNAAAGKVMVERRIIIINNYLKPTDEAQLRQFIAWVEEAHTINLAFSKNPDIN